LGVTTKRPGSVAAIYGALIASPRRLGGDSVFLELARTIRLHFDAETNGHYFL
jgi:hypothetical protein